MGLGRTLVHIEDDPMWARAAERYLRQMDLVELVGTAASGVSGLAMCIEKRPSMVLLDLFLPDADGLDIADELCRQSHPPAILVLSSRCDEALLVRLSASPLAGFIWKEVGFEGHLSNAITEIAGGRRYYQPELVEQIRCFRSAPDSLVKLLSGREISLLARFARGESDEVIGAALGLSPHTVHSHRSSIIWKMGLSGTVELICWARGKGFGAEPRRGPRGLAASAIKA